jgi:hypothetical protein
VTPSAARWSPPTEPTSIPELEVLVPQLRELTDPAVLDEARIWYNRQSERLEQLAAMAAAQIATGTVADPAGAVP